jgi:hypothetical protein
MIRSAAATAAVAGLVAPQQPAQAQDTNGKRRMKVAALCSTYHYLSHAYHIVGRLLDGFPLYDGKADLHRPADDFEIASLFIEQIPPETDLGLGVAARHKIPVYDSIEKALRLGGDSLGVDAVLLIAEHGKYPINEKYQTLYPRHDYFAKTVEVFRKDGRSVPVFVDKHLSYDRAKAAEMVSWSRELGFPLMAGSSLPITWRRPDVEIPLGVTIDDAVVLSRGEIEIFGFHALETLQCFVERRNRHGEKQGVKAVTCLTGDDVWNAAAAGRWSMDLLETAATRSQSRNVGGPRQCCAEFNPPPNRPTFLKTPIYFEAEYADGFVGKIVIANGYVDDTTIALKLKDHEPDVVSTNVYLPAPPGANFFNPLVLRVEEFFKTGKPPYSAVRNQLTGGMLDALLQSRLLGGKRVTTPDLEELDYAAPEDSGYIRTPWPAM